MNLCKMWASAAYLLGGNSNIKPQDYSARTPKLDLRDYLNGNVDAWGQVYDYTGKATTQFQVIMKGTWNGNSGILEEAFIYHDGRKDQRTWTIQYSDDHNFTATASDVIGTAVGSQYGNAAKMRYSFNAKLDDKKFMVLNMEDWLYLLDDKTLINRTKMRKFGLNVGELVITFHKK